MDVLFPSRADAFEFRNQLETKYQSGLGRSTSLTSVDREGEVVWTQEYIRYRVNGCDHPTATQRVMTQIDGNPPGGICAENRDFVILFPPRDHQLVPDDGSVPQREQPDRRMPLPQHGHAVHVHGDDQHAGQ
jgi:hypothetical protein